MRFAVVPATYVFLLRGEAAGTEVLLQLRKDTGWMDGFWSAAAAGHVERGESVFDAAAREAREELGIEQVRLHPLCAMQRTAASGNPVDERVDYFFSAASWAGEPAILEPHKCADLRWFTLAALPEAVVPYERQVLDAVRAGAVPPILAYGF